MPTRDPLTQKVNILVVDDRPENVLALEAILSNADYNVVTAATGFEALKKILKYEFAVILLDVLMPSMDGFETARLILERDASRNVPIIFLTAAGTDMSSMHEGYSVGAVDYLIKPIEPEIVRAKVAVFVDLFRKSKQILRQEEKLHEAERLRSQQALREREAEYEATFEKAAVGIAHVGTDGRCLRINQKFCDIVGYSKVEALALRLENLVHPEDAARQTQGLEKLSSGQLDSFRSEERFVHKSGRTLRIDLTVSLLRDETGLPKKFITVVEDATERKRAEEGQQILAQASKVLLNSLDFSPALTLVARSVVPVLADWCAIDLLPRGAEELGELAVAHVDPERARRLYEVIRRQLPNSTWGASRGLAGQESELIPEVTQWQLAAWASGPEDPAALKALELKSVIIVPLKVRGKVLGAISFLSSAAGRRYSVADVTIAEDLAQRVSLAIENARLYRAAQDAIGARDEFLSIASHELRTPLTPLQIQLQRMLGVRGKPGIEQMPPDQVRAIVQRSATQVRRLAGLIDSLLDVSRITAGRLTIRPEEVDLSELASEVIARFSDEAHAANSALTLSTPGKIVGHCDPLRIEQVLSNLLSNAIKYGAGQPIDVRLAVDGDSGVLTVADRGIGITADQLPTIFDRFERGAAGRNYAGLGLGLYLARQIVGAHGGTIQVVSGRGEGSTFTVRLPLHREEAPRSSVDPVETNPPRGPAPVPQTSPRSVLLVEDDADIQACVGELLRSEGYAVAVANNGREGLDQLARLAVRPDVIVLDLMMPVLDGVGFSLEQRKQAEWSRIPVVVLSGDGGSTEKSASIPNAVFVKKPVNAHDLLALVEKICNRAAR